MGFKEGCFYQIQTRGAIYQRAFIVISSRSNVTVRYTGHKGDHVDFIALVDIVSSRSYVD